MFSLFEHSVLIYLQLHIEINLGDWIIKIWAE